MAAASSPKARPGRRLVPLVAAAAVAALTGGATYMLMALDRGRTADRTAGEAQAAAVRATEGARGLLAALEAQTQNATTNPRLVAALDASVDQETLRDLLLTEPWWEPFRRAVDGYGLFGDETTALVTSHLPAGFDARTAVREARQTHRSSSALAVAGDRVIALCASPVALAGRSEWPVLLATKQLDVGLLAGLAERAGAAVAISDGRRLLVATPAGGGAAVEGLAALKLSTGLVAPGVTTVGKVTVAALSLGSGLRALVGLPAPAPSGGLPLPWSVITILALGFSCAIGIYVLLTRNEDELPLSDGAVAPAAERPVSAIGRYALVERIGQGGMAEIYAAVTSGEGSFRRPVVIKRLRPELTADPNAVSQFCDEANLLAALHHPNIVAVHDFGRWENQYFLAEEYVPGRDLGRTVDRWLRTAQRPMPVEVVAHVGCELLKALEYAHGLRDGQGRPLGVVHRDVSPENVMISALGEVKLLDFGVVKAEGRLTKTEMGVVKGNVTYMSPEQARGLEVDARADLYSLALVLYFCCAGQPLYVADTTYGLLMKAGAGPGIEERAAIRQLPRPFAEVIARATAIRIDERFRSAQEMAAALEPWARAGVTVTGTLVSELFSEELREEAQRLATFIAGTGVHPVPTVSAARPRGPS
jgi:hypothetical protein